jgi:hypothetical protein
MTYACFTPIALEFYEKERKKLKRKKGTQKHEKRMTELKKGRKM